MIISIFTSVPLERFMLKIIGLPMVKHDWLIRRKFVLVIMFLSVQLQMQVHVMLLLYSVRFRVFSRRLLNDAFYHSELIKYGGPK